MLLPEARAEDHDHAPTARIKKVSTLQSFYGFDEVCTVIMSEWIPACSKGHAQDVRGIKKFSQAHFAAHLHIALSCP